MEVLLYVDADQLVEARCRAALEVVRVCGGHIDCLQITSPVSMFSSNPPGVAGLLTEKVARRQWQREALEANMKTRLDPAGVSWSYRAVDGAPAQLMAQEVQLTDLVVLNAVRVPSEMGGAALCAGEVVSRLPVPVMAVPPGRGRFELTGAALIAWDGTAPCISALRGTVELLKAAAAIFIVVIGEEKTNVRAETAREYLAHHGLHARVIRLPDYGQPISTSLLGAVDAYHAAYLVMGAYGRGRTRELVLGGVTREVLASSHVPIVMAH